MNQMDAISPGVLTRHVNFYYFMISIGEEDGND